MINQPGNTVGSRNAPGSECEPWQSSHSVRDPASTLLSASSFSFHEEKPKPEAGNALGCALQAPEGEKKCSLLPGTKQMQPHCDIIGV